MPIAQRPLPWLTADLPGTGGELRRRDEDFRVEEIPAYEPAGCGDHVHALIEKTGLTTMEVARHMARALDARPRDVGCAGLKDKHAVATQRLSFPPPCTPEAVMSVQVPGVRVLSAARHPHKLRTGHLRGNRFALRVVDLDVDAETAAERTAAILARLAQPPGAPNWFGAQRFGARGDNPTIGRALVLGEPVPGGRPPRSRQKRLLVSAYQSLLFNEILLRRVEDALFSRVIAGDLLQRTDSGGIFACSEPATDQARLERGEIVPTGPVFGHRMTPPPPGTDAGLREARLLAEEGLSLDSFKRLGKLARGTRRAIGTKLGEAAVTAVGQSAIEVSFTLPAGAYATAVMREIIKGTTS